MAHENLVSLLKIMDGNIVQYERNKDTYCLNDAYIEVGYDYPLVTKIKDIIENSRDEDELTIRVQDIRRRW